MFNVNRRSETIESYEAADSRGEDISSAEISWLVGYFSPKMERLPLVSELSCQSVSNNQLQVSTQRQ